MQAADLGAPSETAVVVVCTGDSLCCLVQAPANVRVEVGENRVMDSEIY